ncbi:Acetate kinase (Acetokinase) [Legionella geestiana]|uniref:Acetate kinase n=1 Tax=Legionella geestiana TaxID=45065 RepID=A0A0W0U8Z1_9GAMM|nr:acetate/propionate family kinase [Legionella geestiana]KTD04235.1 Acetate kinase (Acetokinase) [Legionella geestiana]QBS11655.1 acetate/propionate family kinase [Legionella geestiana]QDQ40734.1 acetate/propionate family kinase [Legionella geestiana]STX53660.1 Acetate kinase (Acetokinase) [Legionella geestiana]
MRVLTLNAGSSSLKYKLFEHQGETTTELLRGLVENIGESQGVWHHTRVQTNTHTHTFANHGEALEALAAMLLKTENVTVEAVGHRVVHGGAEWYQPTPITEAVLNAIEALVPLAPLHNPANIAGIRFAMHAFPNAFQVAIFDTGFHHTLPPKAHQYAIDAQTAKRHRIRRYGFHGINHDYVTLKAAAFLGKPRETCQLISLHLGNGASACLVMDGESVDTSMGMTPLAGLIMGTRSGDIDPAIVLYLQRQGFTADAVDRLLNQQSGLMGVAGDNDLRRLLAREENGDESARLAIAMYIYSIQKTIGAYLSQTDALDGLIFTGGVGENAVSIRERVMRPLAHLGFALDEDLNAARATADCSRLSCSGIPILMVRGDEERFMTELVMQLYASR